ncbi:MAG: hypothetical protein AAF810_21000 [Cyanobacteria bacterium P01_D01_bin.36]
MTTWHILVESASDGQTIATVTELSTFQVKATTRQQALDEIQQLLTRQVSKAEVVSLPVLINQEANPWIEFGSIFKDDPDFADISEAIQAERMEEL